MIAVFLLIANKAVAPGNLTFNLAAVQPINEYDRLVAAITKVESRGDRWALNVKEQAVGPLQIRPIKLLDYNQRNKTEYQIQDCFSYDFSRQIFLYYAKGKTFEQAARNWNGSGEQTREYWNKIKKAL